MNHVISLAVRTDRPIPDDAARAAARAWADRIGLVPGLTSTARDTGWLRVSGLHRADPAPSASDIEVDLPGALTALAGVLRRSGYGIAAWEAIEAVTEAELERRAQAATIPPMVNAERFAELCDGISRQAIYQKETARKAGKSTDGFPAPVLDGYWLATEAEHYAATRKTKPGPAPKQQPGGGKVYRAVGRPEDGWWIVTVPELDLTTQARRRSEIPGQARGVIAAHLDVDPAAVEVEIALDTDAAAER